MNDGLLVLRLLIGGVLFVHATQKTLGWFQGPGLDGAAEMFAKLGQEPARLMVRTAATCEMVASALLALGFATPLGAAIAAGTMVVAGWALVLMAGSIWNAKGGGEYPLVLAGASVGLGFTGPGRLSLDHAFGLPWSHLVGHRGDLVGCLVVAVALAAATPPMLRSRRQRSVRRAVEASSNVGP
jgi:putative oxidoreductase